MQRELPTPSSEENTPNNLGFDSQEVTELWMKWASNLTPTDLEYLDDQGL